MQIPVPARRLAYRTAYRLLQVDGLIRRPSRFGVKCLLRNEDRILLVRHTYGHRAWDLPGGTMKRGEPPLRAAQREIREELGVQATGWTAIGAVQGISYHRRDTIYCFSAELREPAMTIDAGELAATEWFQRAELPPGLGAYVLPILRREAAAGTIPEQRAELAGG